MTTMEDVYQEAGVHPCKVCALLVDNEDPHEHEEETTVNDLESIEPGDVVCQHVEWSTPHRDGISFFYGVVKENRGDHLMVSSPAFFGHNPQDWQPADGEIRVVPEDEYTQSLRDKLSAYL